MLIGGNISNGEYFGSGGYFREWGPRARQTPLCLVLINEQCYQ
jgi:hypothetical protein